MAKDLGYAIQEGKKQGVELETAATALKLFQNAIADRQGDKDMAAVVEQFRRTAKAS
jgi:3-hydroxyisobutyrate dehydrogenase-like beta-hydroxyacid dehydrogenase